VSLVDQLRAMIGADRPDPGATAGIAELRRGMTWDAVARATGVHKRTLQRIASGRHASPRAGTAQRIVDAVRAERVTVPARDSVVLRTTDHGDKPRERTLTARNLRLGGDTMREVADAYRSGGGDGAMVAAFLAGVGDQWYRSYLAKGAVHDARPAEVEAGAAYGGNRGGGGGGGGNEGDDEYGPEDVDEYDGDESGSGDIEDYAWYDEYDDSEGGYGGG
jgi:hypothetical protein